MRLPYRIRLRLATAAIIASVALVGWVARTTRAQDGARKEVAPPAPAEELKPTPASAPLELPSPAGLDTTPSLPPFTSGAPAAPEKASHSPAGPENDDPEKNARAFVEQNRKVAQEELKKLKDEAERLRTRLGKVEGGIRRWETLLAALENSERSMKPAFKPVSEAPTSLDPAPVASKAATVVRDLEPGSIPPPPPR